MYAGQAVEAGSVDDIYYSPRCPTPWACSWARCPASTRPAAASPCGPIAGRPPELSEIPPGCRFAPRCVHARDVCQDKAPGLTTVPARDQLTRCWGMRPADQGGWLTTEDRFADQSAEVR